MKVYIAVDTSDEYRLIVDMADSIPELAKRMGCSANSIRCGISRAKHDKKFRSRFEVVEIDDE